MFCSPVVCRRSLSVLQLRCERPIAEHRALPDGCLIQFLVLCDILQSSIDEAMMESRRRFLSRLCDLDGQFAMRLFVRQSPLISIT